MVPKPDSLYLHEFKLIFDPRHLPGEKRNLTSAFRKKAYNFFKLTQKFRDRVESHSEDLDQFDLSIRGRIIDHIDIGYLDQTTKNFKLKKFDTNSCLYIFEHI